MRKVPFALAALLLLSAAIFATKPAKQAPPPFVPQPAPQKYATNSPYHDAPPWRQDVSLRRGGQSLDALYTSTDTVSIPEVGRVTSTINIPDDVTISQLDIHLVISHTWMRDLRVALHAPGTPDAREIVLFDLLPFDSIQHMDGWFNDASGTGILEADTPYVCSWRPIDSLSRFTGLSAQGVWMLRILDQFAGDSGALDGWGIDVNPSTALQGNVVNSLTRAPVRNGTVQMPGFCYSSLIDVNGHYSFLQVPTDTFSLQFSKPSYRPHPADTLSFQEWDTLTVSGVSVPPGGNMQLDTAMTTVANFYEFASAFAPDSIPDADSLSPDSVVAGVLTKTLDVAQDISISDLDVVLNITHPYDGDLSIFLESPGAVIIPLVENAGAHTRNFVNCRLSDQASTPVSEGTGPFTGTYRPAARLDTLNGTSTQGAWVLTVADGSYHDKGVLISFALEVRTGDLPVTPPSRRTLPQSFAFEGNFPNPFNSRTEFRFELPARSRVDLVLYNTLGQRVADILQETVEAGPHTIGFDAHGLASGLYVARMTVNGSTSQSKKILLLR
ncbi:MAG TPA: proprotein convertase P-domain-containing protein [bacterium]|jgi:subtilisin-like proprotein convertase family protein